MLVRQCVLILLMLVLHYVQQHIIQAFPFVILSNQMNKLFVIDFLMVTPALPGLMIILPAALTSLEQMNYVFPIITQT